MKALSPGVKRPERDDHSPQLGSKVKMREVLLPLQHIYSRLAQEPSFHISHNEHTWHKITDAVNSFEVDLKIKINVVSIFITTTLRGEEDNLVCVLYFLYCTKIILTKDLTTLWPEALLGV
jgi:hypothetical protein